MNTIQTPAKAGNPKPAVDTRKQLFNDGAVGLASKIQVSSDRITKLNGIMFDLDPDHYQESGLLPSIPKSTKEFYSQIAKGWFLNHPVLAKCEVRMTGRGLHGILWFEKSKEFERDGDRELWAAKVKVIQAALPIDPDQPGITATTRAHGSTNSKTGEKILQLAKGEKVSLDELDSLFEEMRANPFKTVMKILTGEERIEPCPRCRKVGTALRALDHVGECYGSCGRIKLADLYSLVLVDRK